MGLGLGGDHVEGEFALIDWIRRQVGTTSRVALGIGDDCALLRISPASELLATTDMLMDGRHFRLEETGAEAVGYKALAVNLSDIAAMAGLPIAALVSVALPRGQAIPTGRGILAGMRPLADRFGVALVGGDTNAWDGPLVVSVTVLGEAVPPGPVRRSGAMPGDVVMVTGPLGGSLKGRHMHPEARVTEALGIHRTAAIHAMIDISDGLAADLTHILEESGDLGAVLDSRIIPIHPDAVALSQLDRSSPLEHALHDGEDFELCLAVSPRTAASLLASPLAGVSLIPVGEIVAEPGLRLRDESGNEQPLQPHGFDHLRA